MATVTREPLPSASEIARLPPDGGPGFNRLIHSTSPYLLQHARNPVDWYPWSDEAFERAKREDKPVFLSVGYSACHWCHVMEHESFENEAIAKLLNEKFIPVKVDREERPDIDEIYMTATQLMTGSGGWPNSLFLTPDRRPFFAGTYFPPDDRWGRPGFRSVLTQLSEYWRSRRDEVERHAERLSGAMKEAASAGAGAPGEREQVELNWELVEDALADLAANFDQVYGGFGAAPKFPPHGSLELLLREYARTKEEPLLMMAGMTLDAMSRGGIHDQLGGGFARYSTDDEWLVPHFEKMLYDNAQLAKAYAFAWKLTGNEAFRSAAEGIFAWVLREMTDSSGAFHSALDADSEGEEGKYYVWRKAEILEALGEEEGELFCRVYGVTDRGNFVDPRAESISGANILHLEGSMDEIAKKENLAVGVLASRLECARKTLLAIRERRVRPGIDDKILTSWNGLMIESLAYGGRIFGDARYTEAAERAARAILGTMKRGERLLSTARNGLARLNAYLDDYVFLAWGLLELHESTEKKEWLDAARSLVEVVMARFGDERGGYYFTSDDHEMLLYRWKDPLDKALPSGNGVAARVLVRLYRATGDEKYQRAARKVLEEFAPLMSKAMRGMQSFMIALAETLASVTLEASVSAAAEAPMEAPAQAETSPDAVTIRYRILKGPGSPDGKTELSAISPPLVVKHGDRLRVEVAFELAPHWHIQSHTPLEESLIATVVSVPRNDATELRSVDYPAGRVVESGGMDVSIYDGASMAIRAEIAVLSTAPQGESFFEIRTRYQPCMDDPATGASACSASATQSFRVKLLIE